jgi:hypothetical protein
LNASKRPASSTIAIAASHSFASASTRRAHFFYVTRCEAHFRAHCSSSRGRTRGQRSNVWCGLGRPAGGARTSAVFGAVQRPGYRPSFMSETPT